MIIHVHGESAETSTDAHGQFDFSVTKGSHFTVAFAVPTSFVQPDALEAQATLDYQRLDPMILTERPPTKTEEQIRQEERQQVQQEVEARVNARLQRSHQEWSDTRTQMSLVIEDLQAQLRDTLLRLDERERTLRKQLAEQKERQERLPLPVQVQQATQAVQLQQQREQVTEALQRLSGSSNDTQTQAVQQSLAVLTEVSTATRYALTQAAAPVLVMREVKVIATQPVPLPDLEEPLDQVVNPVPQEQVSRQQTSQPAPASTATVTQPPQAAPEMPQSKPKSRPMWPWLAGVAVIALGLGAFWQVQHKNVAVTPDMVKAAEVAPASDVLPGKPVDAADQTEGDLPGVPVSAPKD